jgi:hypothetical protein
VTTTENETETRRLRVTFEPLPGAKPWRAVIVERGHNLADDPALEPGVREIPVGRFDSQHEAITTGVSAGRFVAAGIPWRPVGVEQ